MGLRLNNMARRGALPDTCRFSFTIIELIMVIIIIGIIAVISMPRFQAVDDMKLGAAAKSMIAHLRYVRNIAVARHQFVRVVFSPAGDTYAAFIADDISGPWTALPDPVTGSSLEVDYDDDHEYKGVDVSSADFGGSAELYFNWEGIPRDSSDTPLNSAGTVTLGYNSNSLTLEVTPYSGRVAVQ